MNLKDSFYHNTEIASAQDYCNYPSIKIFRRIETKNGQGSGIISLVEFKQGSLICRISGTLVHKRRLHTTQINEYLHLYDPYFSGYLLHSCDPNVVIDTQKLELCSLKDINPKDYLTINYAYTEDYLVKQFRCQCNASNCKHLITGKKEVRKKE